MLVIDQFMKPIDFINPFCRVHVDTQAWEKFSDSGPYLIGTALIVYGTVVGSEAADQAQDRSYRY